MLGVNSGPATWPDASRLVEAICLMLCRLHPSPRKSGRAVTPRFSAVASDYASIRQLVVTNTRLMEQTSLQLFDINQRTLSQWYVSTFILRVIHSVCYMCMLLCFRYGDYDTGEDTLYVLCLTVSNVFFSLLPYVRLLVCFRHNKRMKAQERTLLVQGVDLPDPPAAATQPLPAKRQLFSEAERRSRPEHTYVLREDTAGQATNLRRRTEDIGHLLGAVPTSSVGVEVELESTQPNAVQPEAAQPVATQPVYRVVVSGLATDIRPGVPGVNFPDVTVTRPPVSTEPASTTYRHKMREALGLAPVNKRKRARNHCATCGRPKTKDTGHSCLYGFVFCPENVEGLSIAQ